MAPSPHERGGPLEALIKSRMILAEQLSRDYGRGRQIADGSAEAIRRSAGAASLEEAFSRLTGVRDAGHLASELLSALDRV